MRRYLLLFIISLIFSCQEEGEQTAKPGFPDTKIFLNSINLDSADRLKSTVELYWFGTDPDGIVTNYEISLDGTSWDLTSKTDSLFNFIIPAGSNNFDQPFYVRSIDNEGNKDPDPAFLSIPINNSRPEANFSSDYIPKDTTLAALVLAWNSSDPDGQENLDSTFIKVNNGPWIGFSRSANLLRIIPTDVRQNGPTEASLFISTSGAPDYSLENEEALDQKTTNFNLEGENTVYIKVKDLAKEESLVDTSKTVFVRNVQGDILQVDGDTRDTPKSFYANSLSNSGINADYLSLYYYEAEDIEEFWQYEFGLYMSFYDKVLFHGAPGSLFKNNILFVEKGAEVFTEFLNQNKKLMIINVVNAILDQRSPLFNYTPLDSNYVPTGAFDRAFINSNDTAKSLEIGYDDLIADNNIRIYSMYTGSTGTLLYEFTPRRPLPSLNNWAGPPYLAVASDNGQGDRNLIFFWTDLFLFKNNPELINIFDQAFNEDFNW